MEKDNSVVESLKKVPFFSGLDGDSLKLLREKMECVTFEKDETVCNEGEKGDRMFIIDTGGLSVLKKGEGDIPVEITVLGPGETAGEMSLFGEDVRSATLRAKETTRAWVLDHLTFHKLLEKNPAIAQALFITLSKHLRNSSSSIARFLTRDVDRRFKVAVFDSKPYTDKPFRENNPYDYSLKFFQTRLTRDTASLAVGCNTVCVFVNDTVDKAVVGELAAMGIRHVALRCAGYNNVDIAACEKAGISVTRVPAYSPYAVAEHAVALMMALNRKIHRAYNRVRDNNFSLNGLVGFDMHRKTVGIIGIGKIGVCAVNILKGFGCRILAYDKFPNENLAKELSFEYADLDAIFTSSDIISLHAPLTQESFHMLNNDTIAKMKHGVMLINTSRGALIDTKALIEGLKTGKIGYAGLDVYEEEGDYFFEDLSADVLSDDVLARLTTFNNVIITSHQAFLTNEALDNIAKTAIENIREFELGKKGKELMNAVLSN